MVNDSNDGTLLQVPEYTTAITSESEAFDILASFLRPDQKKIISPFYQDWLKYE